MAEYILFGFSFHTIYEQVYVPHFIGAYFINK